MINRLKKNIINIPGWRTKRKIVVFESDDWGSIRMPSKKAFTQLLKANISVDQSKYNSLDCLEDQSDLNNLFSVLSNYRDSKNNFPIFTFNTVMGNPDFDKIYNSNFEKFYHESLFDSYAKYYQGNYQDIWQEAMDKKIIKPQFHAREHLNVPLWMHDLRSNYKETKIAFKHNFFGLKTKTSSSYQQHYLAAYRAESAGELKSLEKTVTDGTGLFEQQFGFKSQTVIPCNYVWPTEIEPLFLKLGISLIQGQRGQITPDIHKNGKKRIKRHYSGQQNSDGQFYTVRNVKFEPFESTDLDWVDRTLKEIQNSFFWKKPAIISTHRVNYVGRLDVNHRDRNLKTLDALLSEILKKWPEVEFLSSDELLEVLVSAKKLR